MKKHFLLIISILTLFSTTSFALTIYVDVSATGSNNGTSWTNAYTSFQAAIDFAAASDEIWVAKGTYKPSSDNGLGGGSRYYHFSLQKDIDVYGGFAGTETDIDERENFGQGEANETIFSGDLNGDDIGFTNNAENCYHVFYNSGNASAGARIDGFTISGGNANGSGNHAKGGGMYISGTGLQRMNRIVFSGNWAGKGGGLYSSNAQQFMFDVVYKGNTADYGGGFYTEGLTNVYFYNSIFSGNKANIDGGGIYTVNTRFLPVNATITGNHADNNGGGIYDNNFLGSDLRNSILWENTANNSGAQVYIAGTVHPYFKNCDIQGGSAGFGLSSGTYSGVYENNIDSDPLFVTPVPTAPSTGGDLHLLSDYPLNSSPCYDAGNDDFLGSYGDSLTTDFDGNNRIQIAHVDIGVYEGGNAPPTPTIYVDINAGGGNYGTSWADAFTDLQWAMLIARTCHGFTTIEVAEGTYKTTDGTDRDIYFGMINGISIFGGYPTGGGTRDWENNETILSGDLNDNDIFDMTNSGNSTAYTGLQGGTGNDNSYHVFFHPDGLNLTNSAVLDGFTITGGYAYDGEYFYDSLTWKGGGMYNYSSSPTVINCTFSYNQAIYEGGGMHNEYSSPVVTNCNFNHNAVESHQTMGYGGGMSNFYGHPSVSSCIFSNNYARRNGGGMASIGDSLTVIDCIFSENETNSVYGSEGGGMTIRNVNATISNCSFINNSTHEWGGGMYTYDCSGELTNLVFFGNTAGRGGGIYMIATAALTLNNVSFFNNSANYGGALNLTCYTATINNSILWGNHSNNGNEIWTTTSDNTYLNNCCYSNSPGDIVVDDGSFIPSNCITSNPLYVNPSDGDLRLYGNSPAVNMGQNSYNTTSTDIRGEVRIQNTTIDMGAYEWTSGVDPDCRVTYVDLLASGSNDGSSWTDAYTSLQSALDATTTIGDQIWVAKGTYKPSYAYDLTNTSRYYHFRLIEGVEIYGGFAGTETLVSQRTNYGVGEANETFLNGDLSGNDNFDVTNGGYQTTTGDDNCYHVFYHPNGMNLTSSAILDGFTISGGNANDAAGNPHYRAGGFYAHTSSPTIQNVVFKANSASNVGGAVYIQSCTSNFTNVSFLNNKSFDKAGGIYIYSGSPALDQINCNQNYSANGGALYVDAANPTITNAIVTNNNSTSDGGGLSSHSSSIDITNALIADNVCSQNGGGLLLYSSTIPFATTLTNVTITNNSATGIGGGVRLKSLEASSLILNNSIVSGNTATTNGNEIASYSLGGTTLNYSCYDNSTNDCFVDGGTFVTTNNNITLNPQFVDDDNSDFRINRSSPCVDVGENSYNSESYDIRGEDRIQNTVIDMGAYEWTEGTDPVGIIYVDINATGTNSGENWTNAYTSFNSALDAAVSGNQIWAASGTYKPSYDYGLGGGSRYYHYRLIEGVEIYGGFAGTETLVSQRTNYGDGEANETILNGDLSSNDNFDVTNGGYQGTTGDDNCYHVFYNPNGLNLTSTAVLNGFTIKGGNANAVSDPHNKAGGIYLYSSSPTIQNVIFHSNEADNLGGAAYIHNSTSVFTNMSFLYNLSNGGGALYVSTGNPILKNVSFTGNVSSADGGALSTHSASTTITNALFSSNSATNNGGAVIFYSSSVQFNTTLNNVTLSDNQAGVSGGSIRFASNNAASALNINNSIIWGNTATTSGNELSLVSTGTTTLNYTCYKNQTNDVEVLNGTLTATNNNITSNPQFVDDDNSDFRINRSSPCVDVGENSYNSESYDLRGEDRIQNTTIDMGAYEWTEGTDPVGIMYVDINATGTNNGTNWTNAYTSFQSALDAAVSGNKIWAASGTYKPSYDYGLGGGSRYFHFRLIEGVEIYGGFAGTENLVSQRTNYGVGEANETILNGDLSSNDNFDVTNGGYQTTTGDDNCYHIFYHPNGMNLTSSTILDGFTLSGGNANGTSPHRVGGGIYLKYSSPTIRNVVFTSNSSAQSAGGIFLDHSSSPFANISITNNITESSVGGGISISYGEPEFNQLNCTSNYADYAGGMYIYKSNLVLNNIIFTYNSSANEGGGLWTHSASPTITNALFSANTATTYGGGIYFYSTTIQYTASANNVTISDNQAGTGGGICFQSSVSSSLILNNSIVYGNTATTNGNEIASNSLGGTTLNYSCYDNSANDVFVESGTFVTTNNNITSDPVFVNASAEDFRICGTSPCVNTGNNSYNSETYDIRSENRIQNTTIDMGAYEWTSGTDPLYRELDWTGAASSDWNTSGNWSNNVVPTANDNVTIPDVSGASENNPLIAYNGTADCNNLTVESGATLTLQSTDASTGSLIVNGTSSGEVKVERFLTANKWHYIVGQTNILDDFSTTMGLGTPGSSSNSFYRWDEALETDETPGTWVDILNGPTGNGANNEMNETFVSCRGYGVSYASSDKTLSLSGEPYTTNKSINISKTGTSTRSGSNLVGNPFTSTIAANLAADENSFLNINNAILKDENSAIYLWEEDSDYQGSRDDYTTISNSAGAAYIAPGQAFMIIKKDEGTTSLPFNTNMRKHGSANFYKNTTQDDISRFYLSVENDEGLYNEILIAFIEGMSQGLDISYDAGKLKGNPDIALYTKLVEDNGNDFAHQALPPLVNKVVAVKTGLDVSQAGNYTFKIKELENFDEAISIKLEDKESGSLIDLREIEEYSF